MPQEFEKAMSGMDGSPRVLSVTFGSFSVTLEGFDDPVATLMAVAEYFRELAERDPGFAQGGTVPDEGALAREAGVGGNDDLRTEPPAPTVGVPAAEEPLGEEPSLASGAGHEAEFLTPRSDAQPVPGTAESLEGFAEPMRAAEASREPERPAEQVLTPESGRPDLDRLAAVMGATRLALGLADPMGEPSREPVPEAARPPEPSAIGIHDWGAEEPEEDDWPEDAGGDDVGAGEEWTEGRFTARVLGRGAAPADAPGGLSPLGRKAPVPLPEQEDYSAEGRRLLATSPDQDEEALQRFLSQAEQQLSDPEIARRHEAMAHLKAAVAATEAQRALGEPAPDSASPFREEWAAVALPQNGRGAPPPLRLVASQRVDVSLEPAPGHAPEVEPPAAAPASEPPPRARAASGPEERVSLSFAAFAAQAGASASLPDLLEAAAAWNAVVRREEEVSRSELLRLAAEVMPEPPSREDALRVFGILLRQGRLARVEGGRFRVGDHTRFGPTRHAG